MALHISTYGNQNAPAIVFLHGGSISGWMWNRQVAAFSDYYCIVPDLPEHGKSINERPITIIDCADKIAELIRKQAVGHKAHIIGHSIGAKIIVELLSRHLDVVDHAVIVSALFRHIPFLKLMFNRFAFKSSVMMLKNQKIMTYQVKQFGFKDEDERQRLAEDFRLTTVDQLEHVCGELYKHLQLPDHLASASAPALIIAGEKEPKAMRESVTDISKALPNTRGILFRGCKHDIPWKSADAFNQTIREWLNDKPLTSADALPVK